MLARQHSDELHAPSVRLCAVLSAGHCATQHQEFGNLVGSHSLGLFASYSGCDRYLLAGIVYLLDRARHRPRSVQGQDRHSAARLAAAPRFRSAPRRAVTAIVYGSVVIIRGVTVIIYVWLG